MKLIINPESSTDFNAKESNILQLTNILQEQKKSKEVDQIMLLVEQLCEMEKNYSSVFMELQNVREQMSLLQNTPQQQANHSVIVEQLTTFEGKVKNQYQQMQSTWQKLNEKAGILIQQFKESGIKALNNVCEFLNIKETLIKLRDTARSNAADMQKSIDKINALENEIQTAAGHIKNIGRVVTGKEAISPVATGEIKIFQKIKMHYQKKLDIFEKQAEKLDSAISKFINLEQMSSRTSVREKIRSNQATLAAKEATEPKLEKNKPLQQDFAR
ncbi:MAG: DUF6674 family protein [Suilimivivens sp.]